MKNKLSYIHTEDKDYPITFNINVMEEIQDQYGSMSAWGEAVQPKDGEPKVKELKGGICSMINEAIDIENEKNNTNEKFVTPKQVGRIISEVGLAPIIQSVINLTVESTSTDEKGVGKNE